MSRPLIGLVSGFAPPDHQRSFSPGNSINLVELSYSRCIEKSGGVPLLIPYADDARVLSEYCDRLDGVVFTGGDDLDSAAYGQEMLPTPYPPIPERDEYEALFFHKYFETGKPILGICRGIQAINVFCGGSLIQDMPSQMGIVHHMQEVGSTSIAHAVKTEEKSLIASLFGPEPIQVNSFHHQCVDAVGKGLKVTGYSEEGIVEVIEHEQHPFCLTVQWHPERMQSDERQMRLFSEFVTVTRG